MPRECWVHAVETDLGPLNIGLASSWRKAAIHTLWAQQCSGGVCYERRWKKVI